MNRSEIYVFLDFDGVTHLLRGGRLPLSATHRSRAAFDECRVVITSTGVTLFSLAADCVISADGYLRHRHRGLETAYRLATLRSGAAEARQWFRRRCRRRPGWLIDDAPATG